MLIGCDWAHMNSVWVDSAGDWLLSLNDLSRVIQVDGATQLLGWEMYGDNTGGDWTLWTNLASGLDSFVRQHHAHWAPGGNLSLFDNHPAEPEDPPANLARGIEIDLNYNNWTAEVVSEFDMALECPVVGSSFQLQQSGNTLTTCGKNDQFPLEGPPTFMEFTQSEGSYVWKMEVNCTNGNPNNHPVYRARPMNFLH